MERYSSRLRHFDPMAGLAEWIESGKVVQVCNQCGRRTLRDWYGLKPLYILTPDPAQYLARIIPTDPLVACKSCADIDYTFEAQHTYRNYH